MSKNEDEEAKKDEGRWKWEKWKFKFGQTCTVAIYFSNDFTIYTHTLFVLSVGTLTTLSERTRTANFSWKKITTKKNWRKIDYLEFCDKITRNQKNKTKINQIILLYSFIELHKILYILII